MERGKGIRGRDIVRYLNIGNNQDDGVSISKWGETLAYQLYVGKDYNKLSGYVLLYINDIITENIKLNYFDKGEGKAVVEYLEKVEDGQSTPSYANRINGGYQTRSRSIKVTNKMDLYTEGEEDYLEFITYFYKDVIYRLTGDGVDKKANFYRERLTEVVYFTMFAHFKMGFISTEGYAKLKGNILGTLKEGVERINEQGRERESQQGKLMYNMETEYLYSNIKRIYEREEKHLKGES